jgi:hypothetical protein
MIDINLKIITELLSSIEHYDTLSNYFTQLDPKQYENLNEYHLIMLKNSRDGKYIDERYVRYWKDINLHLIKQMWSNTSCGYESIGGSAFTASYTTIIENHHGGAIFVYYNGKLVYVAKINDKLKPFKDNEYSDLPGINSAKKKLDLIYFLK